MGRRGGGDRRWRWGDCKGGIGELEMGREGKEVGRGRGWGRGDRGREGKRRGHFKDGYDGMPGWT